MSVSALAEWGLFRRLHADATADTWRMLTHRKSAVCGAERLVQGFGLVLISELVLDDGDVLLQAVPGEQDNMINIHCWEEEEPEDMHLECVVDILLTHYQGLTRDDDVRTKSREVSRQLKAAVAANVAQHCLGEGELGDDDGLIADLNLEHDEHSADMPQQADDMSEVSSIPLGVTG